MLILLLLLLLLLFLLLYGEEIFLLPYNNLLQTTSQPNWANISFNRLSTLCVREVNTVIEKTI